MLSIGLWRWYINITVTILDFIHRPVFYLKQDVSETWCSLHEVHTQVGPTDKASISLRSGLSSTWRRIQNQVSETSIFNYDTGRWIISRIVMVIHGYYINCSLNSQNLSSRVAQLQPILLFYHCFKLAHAVSLPACVRETYLLTSPQTPATLAESLCVLSQILQEHCSFPRASAANILSRETVAAWKLPQLNQRSPKMRHKTFLT
jgi:hypothetical protein